MVGADVLIVGGGAVGGVIAGAMQGAVRRVAVLDADREHVARMRAGLRVERAGGELVVPLEAYAAPEEVSGAFDFALLTVKATALDAAVRGVLEHVEVATFVSLGNGLVQDRVAALVGAERLVAGVVELGATNLGPGHVRQTTANPFVVGELDGERRPRTELLAAALGTVEDVRVTADVWGQIWSKLLVNSTFSGLGAVGGCLYGDLTADPEGRRACAAVWAEGHAVALAEGRTLDVVLGIEPADLAGGGEAAERALDTVTANAAATRASMLQDLERGLATEVDVINGAVVDRAARVGLGAPLNARVVELVHRFEVGADAPDFAHVRALLHS